MQLARRIDGPVAVIGDVHGQYTALAKLLDQLRSRPDFAQRWIVFIGDLVDRGPDSRTVLDAVCELIMHHRRTTVVCGNHDLALAAALHLIDAPTEAHWEDRWRAHYDAAATFASYGVELGDLEGLLRRMPTQHQRLLAGLPWMVEHPEHIFVHAGLDPLMPTETQLRILRRRDFSHPRPPWLCSKGLARPAIPPDCDRTVVSGHVQVPRVVLQPSRILLDTTGGLGGDLSCVLLPEREVVSAETADAAATPLPWWHYISGWAS